MTTAARPSGRFDGAVFPETGARPGVIAYVTAGFPELDDTARLLLACQEAGCAAVEVGLPFSDPLADGPVIQATSWRALQNGMTVDLALAQVRQARESGLTLPVAVMTYINPVLSHGLERFAADCAASGVDGGIFPDLPLDEAGSMAAAMREHGLAHIPLVAPTTPDTRIARATRDASGFVYCVGVTGTTGARDRVEPAALDLLQRVRAATTLPRALGFGISRSSHLDELTGRCEAVVIGSALLTAVERGAADAPAAARAFLQGVIG